MAASKGMARLLGLDYWGAGGQGEREKEARGSPLFVVEPRRGAEARRR